MLNMISNVAVAADTRFGSGVGVVPLSGARTVVTGGTRAVVARPRADRAAHLLGKRRLAAGQGVGQQTASKQNSIRQYDPQTIRVAAASGGALGSHPAREPV